MNKRLLTLLLVTLTFVGTICAQGRRGLRLNEVMIVNDSTSVVDDFGRYNAWVELFNSTFGPLEISSVFLTNDRNNNTLYPVPLGDVNTEIPARQHILFWADGEPNKGTFHTNFTFTPGEDNYIAIYDANGQTLIDEIVVPGDLKPGRPMEKAESTILMTGKCATAPSRSTSLPQATTSSRAPTTRSTPLPNTTPMASLWQ